MASLGRTTPRKNSKDDDLERGPKYALYVWLFFFLVTAAIGIYVAIKSYKEYIDPVRVYGHWSEIGAPSWSTDQFILTPEGVMVDSRYIASTFEFDGSIASFNAGGERYEYKVFGANNERLKRLSGGGHVASFIKQGYEHTLPQEDGIGPARRVSLAEHFQSKNNVVVPWVIERYESLSVN